MPAKSEKLVDRDIVRQIVSGDLPGLADALKTAIKLDPGRGIKEICFQLREFERDWCRLQSIRVD
jgi:hypothetical protein